MYCALSLLLFWFGVMAAQAGLLATWCVWGRGAGYIRWLGSILAGAVLAGAYLMGCFYMKSNNGSFVLPQGEVMLAFGLLGPAILITAQIPLWIVKWTLGWRFIRLGTGKHPGRWFQFSIAGMMSVTLVIASAIGCGRWSIVLLGKANKAQFFFGLLGWLLGAALLLATLSSLPAVWAIFRPRKLAYGLLGLTSYVAICMVVFLCVAPVARTHFQSALIMLGPVVGLTLGLVLPLLIARSQGYRLIWGRETEYPQASGETEADKKGRV